MQDHIYHRAGPQNNIPANQTSWHFSASYFDGQIQQNKRAHESLVEHRRLKRACANAQTRQRLRCSYTQRVDLNEDLAPTQLDTSARSFKEAFAHTR